ncbi:hypothetical protein Clacol_006238 [Clathrus columnatus]|uniref:N-acetyltransferase ECO1 n=1 Tax=Clathrus columnatus TaxID=1419009 RepID=A0AAV5ACD5_9AGAM|nr:hypothetical protein Clacol_006238 [Clathrus columnatus]
MLPRPQVKHTYASRSYQLPSSPTDNSSPDLGKRKRPLLDSSILNAPSFKKRPNAFELLKCSSEKITKSQKLKTKASQKKVASESNTKSLTQLHFVVNKTLRTCPKCSFSYIQGALEDETLHKKHCLRVQRGLEWAKEEEREADKAGVRVIEDLIRFKAVGDDVFARIISVPANAGGKIGAKLSSLFDTINLSLSAPALTPETLKVSKAYLFLIPVANTTRERIVGCIIAQRITSAMNVVSRPEQDVEGSSNVVHVDGGLYCSPQLHPTPVGISRLFVSVTHRRLGIATMLLDAVSKTFVYGCVLDPTKGQIAFSQPTGDGQKTMERWGKGGIRIYQE